MRRYAKRSERGVSVYTMFRLGNLAGEIELDPQVSRCLGEFKHLYDLGHVDSVGLPDDRRRIDHAGG